MPIDIEESRVGRGFPILQHVQPPGVIATHDPHVVGHDVEDDSHPSLSQRVDQSIEIFRRANLWIERVVIDDVASVHAAGTRFEAWRQIKMADAKLSKI